MVAQPTRQPTNALPYTPLLRSRRHRDTDARSPLTQVQHRCISLPRAALARSLPSAPSLPLAAAPHCAAPSDRSLSWPPSGSSNVAADDPGGAARQAAVPNLVWMRGGCCMPFWLVPYCFPLFCLQSPWISYYHWLVGYTLLPASISSPRALKTMDAVQAPLKLL